MVRECRKTSEEMGGSGIHSRLTCEVMLIVFMVFVLNIRQVRPTQGEILGHRTQNSFKLFAVRWIWVDSSYFQEQVISFPLVWSNVQFNERLLYVSWPNRDVCPFAFFAAIRHPDTRNFLFSARASAPVRHDAGYVTRVVPRRAPDDWISHKDLVATSAGPSFEYHGIILGSNLPAWRSTVQRSKVTASYKQSEEQ